MKRLHIALLVLGAILAGGLAFEMTQPAPIQIAKVVLPPAPVPPPVPAPVHIPEPVAAPSSPPSPHKQTKPSPMPTATAPPAVYQNRALGNPGRAEVLSNKRTQITNRPAPKPLQWTAVPYQASLHEAQTQHLTTAPTTPPAENSMAAAATPPEPAPTRHSVTLTTGTIIVVRLSEALTADRATAGEHFHAFLAEPLVADGLVIAERGAQVTGRIVNTQKPGWFNTKSLIELELSGVSTSDGQNVSISTDPWTAQAEKLVSVPASTVIRFHLAGRVTVTERPL